MIRDFKLKDLDEVMAIWLQTNISAHPFIPQSFWESNFDFVKMILPTSEIKVFTESGIIKGFIGLLDQYIAGLFVLPDHQTQGIGKALLDATKEHQKTLHLDVYVDNKQALQFYESNGFKRVSTKDNIDTGHPEYFMVWSASH